MVTSEVKMIAHSTMHYGIEIATVQARYWRPIHGEVLTHRSFGRNARSSRAVPVDVLLTEQIFVPEFGMNQRGMQAKDEPVPLELQLRWAEEWEELAEITRAYVGRWGKEGMHKQWANRPLEWFGWIDVLITATDWRNFFELRRHSAAQPEFQILADQVFECIKASDPVFRKPGEWHLPYITDEDRDAYPIDEQLRLSTARSARLSYKPFDGQANFEAEMKRFDSLVTNRPVHASPAEHQATPDRVDRLDERGYPVWQHREEHGNLKGWRQFRKMLPHEQVKDNHYGF